MGAIENIMRMNEKKPRKHFGEPIQEPVVVKKKGRKPKDNFAEGYERIQSPKDIHPLGAQYLVEAIAQKAADDWRISTGALKIRTSPIGNKHDILTKRKKDCEEFFLSGYFQVLTGLDGEVILSGLKKEVRDSYGR